MARRWPRGFLHCPISGKPIKGEDEYTTRPLRRADLVFNGLPMALAGGVDEELNELPQSKPAIC